MTLELLDLASYQEGIDLSLQAYRAWHLVNIKTSQGNWYVADRNRSRKWADQARAHGMGIMTFHWLDASTSGTEQARIAYREMRELGGPDGMAHQADTEDDGARYGPLTWRIWADYVNTMQDLMGRHVLNYTGDWWWTAPGRNWDGAALTPYLMAAPNIGYLSAYPGDSSEHWRAGYGGWDELAAMQYHVGPIPGGGPGADNVSQTAIRHPTVWAALTGDTSMDLTWPKSAPVGDRAAGTLIDDLWCEEHLEHSGFVGTDRSPRSMLLAEIRDIVRGLRDRPAATVALSDADRDAMADRAAATVIAKLGERLDALTAAVETLNARLAAAGAALES